MKKLILINLLLSAAIIINAQERDFPRLTVLYLGQKPPGMMPEHFGVGVIDSNERVFAISFSSDGKECFYTKSLKINKIITTRENNGYWTQPTIARFSGTYFDFEPHVTPDGKHLIFGSMRPLSDTSHNNQLYQWVIKKEGNEWSEPEPLGAPFIDRICMYVSLAENGNIYFTGDDGIYISKLVNGKYFIPEKLSHTINHLQYAAHPFIAPDDSYLIFDAQPQEGNSELFISFSKCDRTWLQPIKFDSNINTDKGELCAFVTRDMKYLFFSRISKDKGDIYWVSAKII